MCVPMDDNVPPRRYEPMIDFFLDRAGLERPTSLYTHFRVWGSSGFAFNCRLFFPQVRETF